MALTAASLAEKMKEKIELLFGPADEPIFADSFYLALAQAVVEEIQQNALVTGTVTSGAGAGGSVTGTVG